MGDKGKAVAVMAGLVAVSGVVFAGVILGAITMWSHNRQIQEAGKQPDAVVTAGSFRCGRWKYRRKQCSADREQI